MGGRNGWKKVVGVDRVNGVGVVDEEFAIVGKGLMLMEERKNKDDR